MWTRHVAPDGRPYYYNAALKTSSWTEPAELRGEKSPTCVGDFSHRWEQHRAPDGRPYFFNPATKQSRWTLDGVVDGVIVNMDETRKKSKTSSIETEGKTEETEEVRDIQFNSINHPADDDDARYTLKINILNHRVDTTL
jgi:hypothetical protein